jgi:hypothetical protein
MRGRGQPVRLGRQADGSQLSPRIGASWAAICPSHRTGEHPGTVHTGPGQVRVFGSNQSKTGPKSVRFFVLRRLRVKNRHKVYQNFTKALPNFTEFSFFTSDLPDGQQPGRNNGAQGTARPTRQMTKDDFLSRFVTFCHVLSPEIEFRPLVTAGVRRQ